MRRLLICVGFAAVGAWAAASAQPESASAHYRDPHYTYKTHENCFHATRRRTTDAITVVFYGSGATFDPTLREMVRHMGWLPRSRGEQNQWYRGHDACMESRGHLGSRPGYHPVSRWHVRFQPSLSGGNPHRDTEGRFEVATTPHHEDIIVRNDDWPCHAVDKGAVDRGREYRTANGSGFDQGRTRVRRAFVRSHHHRITNSRVGNTISQIQCDGDPAGSNGLQTWILLGRNGR